METEAVKHIESEVLYRYLDKALDFKQEQEVIAHIRGCPQCKVSLKEAYAFAEKLDQVAAMNRKPCPSAEDMEAYKSGKLNKDRTNEIKEHLKICRYCSVFEAVVHDMEKQDTSKPSKRKK